ncbi:MAG: hypothetical protein Q9161_008633 [Pseudevernia consocians]
MSQTRDDPTLHLPRILCLHGGGVNSRVFRLQCRELIAQLKGYFRLCFADAPYTCDPGPGMIPVYRDYGPFYRWLRWLPEHPRPDPASAAADIIKQLHRTMNEDDHQGATGAWIGLLGFSQGAKMAASLLFMQQKRAERFGNDHAGSDFRFAVLLAGRPPLISLDPDVIASPALADAAQCMMGSTVLPDELAMCEKGEHVLKLPTIHVHGLQDPDVDLHRLLMDQYCEKRCVRVVEWDGSHRVPLKKRDVAAVVEEVLSVARKTAISK